MTGLARYLAKCVLGAATSAATAYVVFTLASNRDRPPCTCCAGDPAAAGLHLVKGDAS